MRMSDHCQNCGRVLNADETFCLHCKFPHRSAQSANQQASFGGTNIQAGRDVHYKNEDHWDKRPKADMDRKSIRKVWPIEFLALASSIVTLAPVLGLSSLPDVMAPVAVALVVVGIPVSLILMGAMNALNSTGTFVLPLNLGTLERGKNGTTWLTHPVAVCPWCPPDRKSRMFVAKGKDGNKWICPITTQHATLFDHSQLPELRDD